MAIYKDESSAKIVFFHDPLVDLKEKKTYRYLKKLYYMANGLTLNIKYNFANFLPC